MERNPQVSSQAEADAFVIGLGLYATGGGGSTENGRRTLAGLLADGYSVSWVPVESLREDALTCSAFGMGSVAPHAPMTAAQMEEFGVRGRVVDRPALRAVTELGKLHGEQPEAMVASELGGGNTMMAVDAAMRLGLSLVDGDYSGRACPEMAQALPAALGHSPWPLTICDQWGNSLVLADCPSSAVAERIGKSISTVTKAPDMAMNCAHAAFALRAKTVATAIVPNTLTKALEVGTVVLNARSTGADPVQAAVEEMDGTLLFRGEVSKMDWKDDHGYMVGYSHIRGTGAHAGKDLKIWFKNENHLTWCDDKLIAMSPDGVTVVREATGEPLTNAEMEVGEPVAVIGFRSCPQFRQGPALTITSPRHYGFNIDYQRIETLNDF